MSSIPAVLAALTVVAETVVSADWLVINGPIGAVTNTKLNQVVVGDGDIVGNEDLDTMTIDTTEERYTVPVTVSAFVPGSDQGVADALALDVYEDLKRAIREYPTGPTLGVTGVLRALPVGAFTMKRVADDQARYTALMFGVDIWAENT